MFHVKRETPHVWVEKVRTPRRPSMACGGETVRA